MKWTIALLLLGFSLFAQNEDPVLVVAQYRNPPYQIDTGSGYFTELVRATLDEMEINYVVVPKQSYVVSQKEFQLNQFDMLIGQMIHPNKTKEKLFSEEILLKTDLYLFSETLPQVSSIEEIRGSAIAIIQGAPYNQEFFETAGMNLAVTITETIDDAVALVKSGTVQGIVTDSATMVHFWKDKPLPKAMKAPIASLTFTVSFLERTIEKELVDAFAETLKYVKESDAGKALREKWNIQ